MTVTGCSECTRKDDEIAYLKALLALDSMNAHHGDRPQLSASNRGLDLVKVQQQQAILRRQLALIRADVLYMNRHVESVLGWINKVVSAFLTSCGRLSETIAATIVQSASSLNANVSKVKPSLS